MSLLSLFVEFNVSLQNKVLMSLKWCTWKLHFHLWHQTFFCCSSDRIQQTSSCTASVIFTWVSLWSIWCIYARYEYFYKRKERWNVRLDIMSESKHLPLIWEADGAQLGISPAWKASNQDVQSIRQTWRSPEKDAGWKKWWDK